MTEASIEQKRAFPYQQGDLDGQCGIYALINGIIALHPERQNKTRANNRTALDLFKLSVECIPQGLLSGSIHGGWSFRPYLQFVKKVCERSANLGLSVKATNILSNFDRVDVPGFLKVIEGQLNSDSVILLYLGFGEVSHMTVLRGLSDNYLRLIDSDAGFTRVAKQRLVPWGDMAGAQGKVQVDPRSTIKLSRTG